MTRDYECPACHDWVSCPLDSENFDTNDFNCPWCNQRLTLDADAEFVNGSWKDLSKLIPFVPKSLEAWTDQNNKEIIGKPEENEWEKMSSIEKDYYIGIIPPDEKDKK